MGWISVFACLTYAQSKNFKVRLGNWNSGRVYIKGPWMGHGIYSWSPVCKGTGTDSIDGENAQNFGETVCKSAGFGNKYGRASLEFVGIYTDYKKFMHEK